MAWGTVRSGEAHSKALVSRLDVPQVQPGRRVPATRARHGLPQATEELSMSTGLVIRNWECTDCRFLADWLLSDHPQTFVEDLGARVMPSKYDGKLVCAAHEASREEDEKAFRQLDDIG